MRATARDLVGRTIVAVEFNRFADGRGKRATEPVLTLDNGRRVSFFVQETDVGGYGVEIIVSDRKVKP